MVSLKNWLGVPLEGALAQRNANVSLPAGPGAAGFRIVHAWGACYNDDTQSGWSSNFTVCGKQYKHHNLEKNRRTEANVTCILCLTEAR